MSERTEITDHEVQKGGTDSAVVYVNEYMVVVFSCH